MNNIKHTLDMIRLSYDESVGKERNTILQCNFVRRQQQRTTALYVGVNERPEDKQLPGLIVILCLPRDRPIEYLLSF